MGKTAEEMSERLGRTEARVAGTAMLAAPILLLIASLIHPPHAGSAESWLHAAESGPTRFYLAHLLFLGAAALLVPATLGLGRLAHPTQTTLTALGVGITLLGILGIGALVGSDFVVWKMADPSAEKSQMLSLLERVTTSPGFVAPLYALAGGIATGPAVLALALHREGQIPSWATLMIAAGAPAFLLGIPTRPIPIAAAVCMLTGLAATARATFRTGRAVDAPDRGKRRARAAVAAMRS